MKIKRLSSYKITLLHQFYSAFLTVILLNDTCLKILEQIKRQQ